MENSTAIPNGSLAETITYSIIDPFNQTGYGFVVPVIHTYALVISAFILAITAILGLLSSSVVLTALTVGRLLKHYHYILLTALLIINILFNVVWSPLEIVCLLLYQSNNTLFLAMKDSAHSLYFMLLVMIGGVLCLFLLWFFFCYKSYTKQFTKYLVMIGLPLVILLGISLATLYGCMSLLHEYRDQTFYHLLNKESYIVKLISLTIIIGSLFIGIMILLALRMRQLTFNLAAESVTSVSEHSITLPTLTPSDSGSEYRELKHKPNKQKESKSQLMVNNLPTVAKSEQGGPRKNSFALNSAALMQMFQRRRHTISNIGEIGDNGLSERQRQAQGYGYVRKFSVDITALQAQLEDPKSHSSMSSFKSAEDMDQQSASFSFIAPGKKGCSIEEPSTSNRPLKKASAPPRIMVEPVWEEELHQTIEQKMTDERQTQNNFRLCLLLLITFILSVIPMYITESMRSLLTQDSYINSLVCVTAFSSIQTVIFPNIMIFMDSSIYKVLRNLISKCCVRKQVSKQQKETQSMLPQNQASDFSISQL